MEIKEFKDKLLHENAVTFSYIKKDGTERHAVGTMKPELLPKAEPAEGAELSAAKHVKHLPEGNVLYYDLDRKGFRSFKFENIVQESISF